ncbi:MAG: hypothetical protein ACOCUA_03080 [archaeon]
MSMTFPHEAVPDGAIFAPHHYTYGALLAILAVFIVWDNYRDREPLLAAVGLGMGLFGFLSVWPYYPPAGAILALTGPLVAIAAVVAGSFGLAVGDVWDDYPRRERVAVVLFSLVALDDALEHAFGVWTPLDALWASGLSERTTPLVVGVVALLVAGGVVYAVASEVR